jgi:CheY-like chemotaxis protein
MVREWLIGGSRYGPQGRKLGPASSAWFSRQGEAASECHTDGDHTALSIVVGGRLDTGNVSGLPVRLWGCRLRIAWKSVTVLELTPLQGLDAVLFDLVLPERNGLRIARRLRTKAGFKKAELIAMQKSGHTAAQESDFDTHLVKTLTAVELRELLGAVKDKALAMAL